MKRDAISLDPVFEATGYRCAYCNADLLQDLSTFLSKARDHFRPKSLHGRDGDANRVPACAACDRLKKDREFSDLAEARAFIAAQRAGWALRLEAVRREVRPAAVA